MSGDQTKQLDAVVDAYRIYQRMMEIGSRGLQSAAFKKYRMRACSYHKTWGVWPRYATTRSMGRKESTPTPRRLAAQVIHCQMQGA